MFNRVFSKREKFLLILLAIMVVVAVYYWFVQVPYQETVPTADQLVAEYDAQYETLQLRYQKMIAMQEELDSMRQSDKNAIIPEYNNLSQVILFLDTVLTGKNNYTASFSAASIGGDNIARRTVSVSFNAASYKEACEAIASLQNCPYLCRIDNVSISPSGDTLTSGGNISVSVTILYYETTVGVDLSTVK